MKTIAIQRNVGELKRQLEERGYRAVYTDEVSGPVDALIYLEDSNNNILSSMAQNPLGFSGLTGSTNAPATGPLIINAKGKDIDEICKMIENRLYTPLFRSFH